jgi:hypothetical protein
VKLLVKTGFSQVSTDDGRYARWNVLKTYDCRLRTEREREGGTRELSLDIGFTVGKQPAGESQDHQLVFELENTPVRQKIRYTSEKRLHSILPEGLPYECVGIAVDARVATASSLLQRLHGNVSKPSTSRIITRWTYAVTVFCWV